MPGRSLRASKYGIALARDALNRRNLTQMALVSELQIASWSTVSKFFTGKPVDRRIFIDLCEALDLDWEEVAQDAPQLKHLPDVDLGESVPDPVLVTAVPPTRSTQSDLLAGVQRQATMARQALMPRILARIPRRVVQQRYLPAIARGGQGLPARIVPIVAPAGYGKSIVLGDVYDALVAQDNAWVGLVLCSSLSLSTGFLALRSYMMVAATFASAGAAGFSASANALTALDEALGQSLTGRAGQVSDFAAELTATVGRGVLLVDTLDLVISRDLMPGLQAVLQRLTDGGTTVVLTCRDHDYHDYLEPVQERLVGLADRVDRYNLPNFTDEEIHDAALAFFQTLEPDALDRGEQFAENILTLSADHRPLREIIQNPLLLALLCDLFAQEAQVPPDLTVSKLYQRYWQEKIAYSRIDQSRFSPLALAKDQLCVTIAQRLFHFSQQRLCESAYRDELGLDFTPVITEAYNDLLSEGVLEHLPSGRLHFFHQTLLEYAIAYWLTRQSAQAERLRWLSQLQPAEDGSDRTYWLPVLRQFLTILDETEFTHWLAQLDLNNLGIFGAVAYAVMSRDRAEALQQLLPMALQLGEPHQRRLRQALATASRPLVETTWDFLLTLLQRGEHATASNTAQMMGELLERWWSSLESQLGKVLATIAARPLVHHPKFAEGYDDKGQLLGWLLQPCWPLIQAAPAPYSLQALRQHLPLFGYTSWARVVECHRAAAPAEQHALLRQLLTVPVPRYDHIKEILVTFLADLLPDHLAMPGFPLGATWESVLDYPSPQGWGILQAKAIGRWAARDLTLFHNLLTTALFGDMNRIGALLTILTESFDYGASAWLAPYLSQRSSAEMVQLKFSHLAKILVRSVIDQLSPRDQEAIAQWLQPYAKAQATILCRLLNELADASPTAQQLLTDLLDDLPAAQRQQMQHYLLRFQPIATHPPLHHLPKSDQRFLIGIYQQQAKHDPTALAKLLEASQGKSSDIAIAASCDLDRVCDDQIDPLRLLPLLNSPFPGVRVHAFAALTRLCQTVPFPPGALPALCEALHREKNQTAGRHCCEWCAEWVRQQQKAPAELLLALTRFLQQMAAQGELEGGIGRSLITGLKRMARSGDPDLKIDLLSQAVSELVTHLHLIQVKNGESELVDVLAATQRLNPTFLADLLQKDGETVLQRGWIANFSAIVKTIRKVEGPNSTLLGNLIQQYADYPEVANLVLAAKGL